MKDKKILILNGLLFLLILVVSNVYALGYQCYQESANITNQTGLDGRCNLNYSGNYTITNVGSGNLTINYTKPQGIVNNSYWEVSTRAGGIVNYSIDNCINTYQNTLSLLIVSKGESCGNQGYFLYCRNDTGWFQLAGGLGAGFCAISPTGNDSSLMFDGNWSTSSNWDGNAWRTGGTQQNEYGKILEEAMIWNIGLLENNQIFNITTYENSNENFYLNVSYDSVYYSNINAYLYYNNTIYNSTVLTYGNYKIFNSNLIIPSVSSSGTNKSFNWIINLTNSSGTYSFNSSFNNQTILKAVPVTVGTTCSAGLSPILNFTSYYEQTLNKVNMSVNYVFYYGTTNNTLYQINNNITNVGSFVICINNSQSYYNVGYGEIQYNTFNSDSVNRRYYVFSNTRLTNQTTNVSLYNLEVGNSTSFLFTAQSTTLIPYVNYYVALFRWYPNLNSYNLVDMGKTDDQGQTILHVKTEDTDYRIGIYANDGTLINLFKPVRFTCQTTPCTYSLSIDTNPLDLTTFTNIQYSLTFDSNTKRFNFIYNDPSQKSQTMNLTVYKDTAIDSYVVCSSTTVGYAGSIFCDVSTQTGILRAVVTRTASPLVIFAQLTSELRSTIINAGGGSLGLFIGALLLIFFALIGTISPVLVVILGIISLVPLFIMGNIAWEVLVGIGVIGGVILHFMRRVG